MAGPGPTSWSVDASWHKRRGREECGRRLIGPAWFVGRIQHRNHVAPARHNLYCSLEFFLFHLRRAERLKPLLREVSNQSKELVPRRGQPPFFRRILARPEPLFGPQGPQPFSLPIHLVSGIYSRPGGGWRGHSDYAGRDPMRICDLIKDQETYQAELGHSVLQTVCAMVERNIGAVPVVHNGKLVGIFS